MTQTEASRFFLNDQDWVRIPYTGLLCILVLVPLLWRWKWKLPVYLLDFQVYKPPDRYVT